tara:strand:- start:300 stop:875 length:576 start_codon:yes stop_codon:yes gene_type:complete
MSDGGTTEVEFAGVKFRGGKIFIIITALSTLGGGLYAGFEFYKDYINMRTKIEKYTAPDLSGFDKRLDVLNADMRALTSEVSVFEKLEDNIQKSADATRDEAREIKRDLKGEIVRGERMIESIERRVKGIQDDTRIMIDKENTRNNTLRDRLSTRMDSLDDSLTNQMKTLKKETNEQIIKALKNPLANMRK